MSDPTQKVYFFYPHSVPALEGALQDSNTFFTNTSAAWILQTYQKLSKRLPCLELTNRFPERGIVFAFVGDMPHTVPLSRERYLVAVVADSTPPSYANLHVVQNRKQTQLVPRAVFVPHWPQPGLVRRDPRRGSQVRHAAFIGDEANIATELTSNTFSRLLRELGVAWELRFSGNPRVADFSEIDVFIAIRSFSKTGFVRKPASKLQNAWLAEVPAILGIEYAFQEIGTRGQDYLEATSVEDVIRHMRLLKSNPSYFANVVELGRVRAQRLLVDIEQTWIAVIELAQEEFRVWNQGKSFGLRILRDGFSKKARGVRYRVFKALGHAHNAV